MFSFFLNVILSTDFTILKTDFNGPSKLSTEFTSLRFDICDGFDFVSIKNGNLQLVDNKKLDLSGPSSYKGMQKIYFRDNKMKKTKSSCLLFNDKMFDTSRIHLLELAIKLNYILKSSESDRKEILELTLKNKSSKNIVPMLLSEPSCSMKTRMDYFQTFLSLLVSLINKDTVNLSSINELVNVTENDFYNINCEISKKLSYINLLIPYDSIFNVETTKKIALFLS